MSGNELLHGKVFVCLYIYYLSVVGLGFSTEDATLVSRVADGANFDPPKARCRLNFLLLDITLRCSETTARSSSFSLSCSCLFFSLISYFPLLLVCSIKDFFNFGFFVGEKNTLSLFPSCSSFLLC